MELTCPSGEELNCDADPCVCAPIPCDFHFDLSCEAAAAPPHDIECTCIPAGQMELNGLLAAHMMYEVFQTPPTFADYGPDNAYTLKAEAMYGGVFGGGDLTHMGAAG